MRCVPTSETVLRLTEALLPGKMVQPAGLVRHAESRPYLRLLRSIPASPMACDGHSVNRSCYRDQSTNVSRRGCDGRARNPALSCRDAIFRVCRCNRMQCVLCGCSQLQCCRRASSGHGHGHGPSDKDSHPRCPEQEAAGLSSAAWIRP